LAVFLLITWEVYDPGQQLYFRDTGRLIYPIKKYVADRLLQGQIPLWAPWTESGTSLFKQVSPGFLHPWTLLYLSGLPFDLAFKLNHTLPLLLAGVGTYLLARRLGASRTAATCGGIVFGASGYLVSLAGSNLNFVVGPAGVPIALERFLAFLDRPSRGRLLAASALLALCPYVGEPQSMLMGGLIGAAFAICRALSRQEGLWRTTLHTALWGGLALALSAPVALPAASAVAQRSRGLTRTELTRFAGSPLRIPGLIVPRAFDDAPELAESVAQSKISSFFVEYFGGSSFAPSIYLGSAALLLAWFALLAGRRGRFFLFGGCFLTLAEAGDKLGLQPILNKLVPGYGLFRYAEKQMAFASLLFAVAAALGLDAAFANRRRMRALALAAGLCAMGFAGSAVFAATPSFRESLILFGEAHVANTADVFVGVLRAGLRQEAQLATLFAVVVLGSSLRPLLPGRALATVICGVALVLEGGNQLPTIPVEFYRQPPLLERRMTAIAGPSAGRWRMYVEPELLAPPPRGLNPKIFSSFATREPLRPHYNSLFHVETVSEYFSAHDSRYELLLAGAARQVFELLTVRFFVLMPQALSAAQAASLGFQRTDLDFWMMTLPPAPRARLFDRVELADSETALAKRLTNVDFYRTAIFLRGEEGAAATIKESAPQPGRVELRRLSPERMSAEVDAAEPAVLEVGEHYDPGWRVQVDGKGAEALAVHGAILGTVVPSGHHRVELRFIPTGLIPGIGIAILALIALWVTKHVVGLTFPVTARM
jgi:hypothetical protein